MHHRADRRSAREEPQADGPHRVVRVRVEQADRLPRPETEPAGDDRHRQRWRGEERQDVIRAVAGRAVAVAVQPVLARQQSIERGEQVVVGAGADLDDDEARGRVRDEDRQEAVAAGGRVAANAAQSPVRSTRPRPWPVRTVELARVYGKMLRIASRSRPRPPPAGADS